MATKKTTTNHKRTTTRTNKKYNWVAIKEEYVSGDNNVTIESIAGKYGVAKSVVGKRSSEENWVEAREQFRYNLGIEIRDKLIKKHSVEIVKATDFLAAILIHYKKHLFEEDANGGITPKLLEKVSVDKLNSIMTGVEKNIKLTKLIIGEATEHTTTDTLTFEERIMLAREERGLALGSDTQKKFAKKASEEINKSNLKEALSKKIREKKGTNA